MEKSKIGKYEGIFGDKDQFAIEASIRVCVDEFFIGLCYWINGVKFGDNNLSSLLSLIIGEVSSTVEHYGQKQLNIYITDHELLTNKLIDLLWGEDMAVGNMSIAELRKTEVSPVCECFDGYHVFLIEQADYDLMLAKDVIADRIASIKLQKKLFKKVFDDFYSWLAKF